MASVGNADDEGALFYAIQLLFSGQLLQAVATAIELNLFDIICEAAGPISPSDIASRLKSSNPNAPQMINRLLQLLASYNIVSAFSSGTRFWAKQLLYSGQLHQAVTTAIELNLFDIICEASGPISPFDIASRLKSSNPNAPQMINRLLQLLASYNIVSAFSSGGSGNKEEINTYGPTPVCKFLLNKEEGFTLAATRLGTHTAIHNSWLHMKDAILNGGIPFEKANGMPLYQYLDADPKFHDIFFKGITSTTNKVSKMIVEVYKGFEGLSSLVDVGGGPGITLNMIISEYPNIKGINFDLPHVIAAAPSYPGIEHIMGDMFVNIPKAEAIFLKEVLHNWSDQHCVKLLQNCYKAIPENGKVIIAERLLPAVPKNASHESRSVIHMDCTMMSLFEGRERTEKEFKELATAAGFQGFRLDTTRAMNFYIMELTPALP